MQGLWRQISKPSSLQPLHHTTKTQMSYIDELSKLIKTFKKKQQLYIKLLEWNCQKPNQQVLKNQHEINLNEESTLLATLAQYQQQPFSNSKTYLYSVFMRVNEVIEYSRHKTINFGPKDQKLYTEHKNKMLETYQNFTYFKNFDVLGMLQLATKLQNQRISNLFPRKKSIVVRLPPSLQIVNKNHQRIKSLQSSQIYKKSQLTITVMHNKTTLQPKQAPIDALVAKKLQTSNKQITIKKIKPININKLYKIIQIKPISVQQFIEDRRQLEKQMMERNQKIIEQRKKWQKMYQNFQNSNKIFRTKIVITSFIGKQSNN